MFTRTNKEIEYILNTVLIAAPDGNVYTEFANYVGQRWLFPEKDAKMSYNLFSPNTVKGKIFKILLPYFKHSKILRNAASASSIKIKLSDLFHSFICDIFSIDSFSYAIFEGSPCVHQKITIQIYKGDIIYGYCKLSMNPDIVDIFEAEQRSLDRLNHLSNKLHIPKCLYCGTIEQNINCFVQTTELTKRSKVVNQITDLHWDFMSILHENTCQDIKFEDSDFYNMLIDFMHLIEKKDSKTSQFLKLQIEIVLQEYSDQGCRFSIYHGDFTPWNCFVEQDKLFVYDFEYLRETYPPFLDYFHFFTQSCIYQKRLGSEDIFKQYLSNMNQIMLKFDYPNKNYKYYLLHIIHFYMRREQNSDNELIDRDIATWVEILKLLNIYDKSNK
ncbi:MAG: hypothetical protein R3Y08_00975 [Rikenellaceae bacterium]